MQNFYGKNVEEAVAEAMQKYNVTDKSKLNIQVLDEGKKGFLGLGSRGATVFISVNYDPEKIAYDFLKELTLSMDLLVDIDITKKDNTLNINLKGDNVSMLIGKRGQTLDSIQYLTSLVVNKGEAEYCNIIIDCENYREKRVQSLEKLANNLAKKVCNTKRNAVLEPMSAYERRIIHNALQGSTVVETYSEGKDSNRHVVIALKRKGAKDKKSS